MLPVKTACPVKSLVVLVLVVGVKFMIHIFRVDGASEGQPTPNNIFGVVTINPTCNDTLVGQTFYVPRLLCEGRFSRRL